MTSPAAAVVSRSNGTAGAACWGTGEASGGVEREWWTSATSGSGRGAPHRTWAAPAAQTRACRPPGGPTPPCLHVEGCQHSVAAVPVPHLRDTARNEKKRRRKKDRKPLGARPSHDRGPGQQLLPAAASAPLRMEGLAAGAAGTRSLPTKHAYRAHAWRGSGARLWVLEGRAVAAVPAGAAHLERGAAIPVHIQEQAIRGGPPRQQAAQHCGAVGTRSAAGWLGIRTGLQSTQPRPCCIGC